MVRHIAWAAAGLICGGCLTSPPPVAEQVGARELRPARTGINVGSLNFARETATNDISKPINLERLCEISLVKYAVQPVDATQADIDLSSQIDASAAASGIKNIFVNLGLSGNFSDFFEYKLTNVVDQSITYVEAERIFRERSVQRDCRSWRSNISRENWARYQVLSVKIGDIVMQRKSGLGGSVDLQAKIAVAQPQIKATLSRKYNLAVSGKGLVVAVNPIVRD